MASAGSAAAATLQSSKPAAAMASPISNTTSSTPAAGKQKSTGANGTATRPKPKVDSKSPSAASLESNTPDRHAHDRLLFLVANFVGSRANVTVKSGEIFTGIFSGASLESTDSQVVLKMTKKVSPSSPEQPNGGSSNSEDNDYVGVGEDYAMAFDLKDVADVNVPNVVTDKAVKLVNGTSASFRTDTEISGNLARREKELQQWEPSEGTEASLTLNGSAGGSWNQFEANERLYGVKTDYNENIYTTSIDRSSPSYRQRAAAAEEIARRIEGTTTTDAHVAEERGAVDDEGDGLDEEDRYSGVRRDVAPLLQPSGNRYTPPARRVPAPISGAANIPADPAIISSQVATRAQSPQKQIATGAGSEKPAEKSAEKSAEKASEKKEPTANDKKDGSSENKKIPAGPAKSGNEQGDIDRPIAKPTIPSANSSARQRTNAIDTVEKDVLGAFRTFAQGEKQKTQERREYSARKEKEVKFNDLKKFASSFKLKSEVPKDMLGILAKDKDKQDEIVEKSKRAIKEQQHVQQQGAQQAAKQQQAQDTSPAKRAVSAVSSDQATTPRAPGTARVESNSGTPATASERRNARDGQSQPHMPGGRNNNRQYAQQYMTPNNARVPGNLGKNLMAIQNQRRGDFAQPMPGQDPRMMMGMPMAPNVDMMRNSIGPGAVPPNRFNVEAMEFRPNPAASTFMPSSATPSSISPVANKTSTQAPPPQAAPPPTESIFSKGRPSAEGKKVFKDYFNPVKRLKKSVEGENRAKDFANNAGIPQAYRTPPTWDFPKENEEKSYKNMFEQSASSRQSASPANVPTGSEHSTPFPNQGQQMPPPMIGQGSRHGQSNQMQGRGDQSFDDPSRMHPSSSNSSVLPSPRFNHPSMMPPNGQMYPGPMQPGYAQPMPQFVNPNNPMFMRPIQGNQFAPQPMPMAPPMMQNPSGGMMNVPMQTIPMYAPNGQVYAPTGPQGQGTPGNFYSPRTQMMVPHGSQQGQQPQQTVYMQPGQPMYAQQSPSQMPHHMRGGPPMQQHQGSYGSSPRMQNHYPSQQRGMPYPNQYPQQPQMPHGAPVMQQNHSMHGPEDAK